MAESIDKENRRSRNIMSACKGIESWSFDGVDKLETLTYTLQSSLKIIGDTTKLPEDVQKHILKTKQTKRKQYTKES